jgi:hypothetical protein
MNRQRLGIVMFCLGGVILFASSWLIPWWTSPVWQSKPAAEFAGTPWAVGGPIFMGISLSTVLGIVLVVLGIRLYGESGRLHTGGFSLFVVGVVLAVISYMFPSTMGYYPVVFGIAGGLILALFYGTLWIWAKRRRTLQGPARTAIDFQLVSYGFYLLIALNLCVILGNPMSGLYFPERVLHDNALPVYYSMGTKVAIYLALAWLFTFLSQYKAAQAKQ